MTAGEAQDTTGSTWVRTLAAYARPDRKKAIWQIVTSIGPYLLLWAAMLALMQSNLPYVLTLALAFVAAGFVIRTFIIFHDCCHGSFFATQTSQPDFGHDHRDTHVPPYEP